MASAATGWLDGVTSTTDRGFGLLMADRTYSLFPPYYPARHNPCLRSPTVSRQAGRHGCRARRPVPQEAQARRRPLEARTHPVLGAMDRVIVNAKTTGCPRRWSTAQAGPMRRRPRR
jgi:hypothetical protein